MAQVTPTYGLSFTARKLFICNARTSITAKLIYTGSELTEEQANSVTPREAAH